MGLFNIDRTEDILNFHLDGDFRVFPMAEDGCRKIAMEEIGQQFGVKFPKEYLAHVCGKFPGIYVEAKEEVWPRPQPYDVGPFWSFLYGIHTYTASDLSEEWMRLDAVGKQFQESTGKIALPILQVLGDADVYCTDQEGRLVRYLHEENRLEVVDRNFWEIFETEIQELVERKNKKTVREIFP